MISGIFLAAGKGERFGSQKLITPIGGRPLFISGLENCIRSKLEEIIVVLGSEPEKIKELIEEHFHNNEKIRVVVNRDFKDGIISSFNTGLSLLGEKGSGAMMILADMPFVSSFTIDRLIGSWSGMEIVLPVVDGYPSHPRIFPAIVFPDFFDLDHFDSGKEVLIKNHSKIKFVEFKDAGEFTDIDTEDDLGRYLVHETKNSPIAKKKD